jgi:hypothetical protein
MDHLERRGHERIGDESLMEIEPQWASRLADRQKSVSENRSLAH